MNDIESKARNILSVVMPVYNEGPTVAEIIRRVLAQPVVLELIIVNDGSTDSTLKVLQEIARTEPRIQLFNHEINQGKGAALQTGFKAAKGDVVIVQDADLEYSPSEYIRLLTPIVNGEADVVFGTRFMGSDAHRVLYFWHSVGNYVLTLLSNMATNLNLTDMETCFKAFRREIIQSIEIQERRFGFEPEITAKLARISPPLRIYEVAISYHGRTYEEGKKIGWRDGIRALIAIVKYNFFS
jgi:glycosyltransferase involved in cell wall biosynthesis